jgi:pimeloyl-ACP methyl ester carboxylesterase
MNTGAQKLETSVCGALREPFVFWTWSRAAGTPDAKRALAHEGVSQVSFTTRDRRVLRGYRVAASSPAAGRLLIAQGNAMLADQLVEYALPFARAGYEVSIYDYRGYGASEGKRRLRAMVSDYVDLIAALNAARSGRRLLYGISFGGIVLLNAIGRGAAFDALVIDSSPARLSPYGCPKEYDPVEHLPADSSRVMIVSGGRDGVVPPSDMRELVDVARARGASVLEDPDLAHPFMDADVAAQRRRTATIAGFLLRNTP